MKLASDKVPAWKILWQCTVWLGTFFASGTQHGKLTMPILHKMVYNVSPCVIQYKPCLTGPSML